MIQENDLRKKNLLHLLDVSKSYGCHVVLEDIDLSIGYGEFCTMVGPSGHGKSTLLRLILGQELPTSGCIFIENKEATFTNRDRGIVYQKYSLFPHLNVMENILLGPRLVHSFLKWREKKEEYKELAVKYLKKVHLEEHHRKYPHELSGGMQQRVAILQALIMKPKILMMDEPFGALDPGTREDMQVYLLELWKETKMTIIFVTHDLEEAIYLGTRLLTISKFYKDDSMTDLKKKGARIVTDIDLLKEGMNKVSSAEVKYANKFRNLIKQIRLEGFDPHYLQHVKKFNLNHPDSFQTL